MELAKIVRQRNPNSAWLLNHRKNVTSQCGEDGIIEKIFERLPRSDEMTCVEFGAWDGRMFSNTYNLTTNRGWRSLYIEADEKKFVDLQNTFKDNSKAFLVNKLVHFDNDYDTLDKILASSDWPADFDLLSIDIDGNDYHVWNSLTLFSPKVVIVEFNPTIPNDIHFVQERSMSVNQGSSLLAFQALGRSKGYQLVCVTEWNAIFVRDEFFNQFEISDNSPDAMHVPVLDGRIFQAFDGTIYTFGIPKLLWHDVELGHEDFQVLPKSMRVYGVYSKST